MLSIAGKQLETEAVTEKKDTNISSSDFPAAYASAVSNMLMPASKAALMISYKYTMATG